MLKKFLAIGSIAVALILPGDRSPQNAAGRQIDLRPCDAAGSAGRAQCGTLDVAENRASGSGRRIALNIVVVPAAGPAHAPDPVFWLEGGPGGAATQAIGPVVQQYLRGVRDARDVVFVDQRGTGKSNPLTCDDIGESPSNLDRYFGPLFPPDSIRACRQKLEKTADLRQYTTSIAMDDLDDVREALGYRTLNLAGASYGTQAALVYMRRHGEHVRSAFLAGVVPPDFRLPLPFARASQHALDLLLADCAVDQQCHASFPDVKREFDAVLARFGAGPMRVTITDAATRQPRTLTLVRESYVEHLRLLLYTTAGARFLPIVVHQAYLGNFLPFLAVAVRYNAGAALARGMYFSITCSEDLPFISEKEITEDTRGTFLGDRRIRAHQAACAEWPRAAVPPAFLEPIRSAVPTVLFSGDADGATPPWLAGAAVRFLTNGRQILVPHMGHQISGPCSWDVIRDFIDRPSVRELDASCTAGIKRPAFATEVPQ